MFAGIGGFRAGLTCAGGFQCVGHCDGAWIFDDAICAGEGYVDRDSILRDRAIVCDCAYVSHKTVMLGDSRAEDDAYVRGAKLSQSARASGNSMILQSTDTKVSPILTGICAVYGKVIGDVRLTGNAVVFSGEEICNTTRDTLIVDGQDRIIVRAASRDELTPRQVQRQKEKPRTRGMER